MASADKTASLQHLGFSGLTLRPRISFRVCLSISKFSDYCPKSGQWSATSTSRNVPHFLGHSLLSSKRPSAAKEFVSNVLSSPSSILCKCGSTEQLSIESDPTDNQAVFAGTVVESRECEFSEFREDAVAFSNCVQTATFGMGCFWSPEALFGAVPGVIRTRVGYAGGSSKNPSYENMGTHTECVQLEYDVCVTSYADLLKLFWHNHDPTTRGIVSQQYASLLLVHTPEQRQLAEESLQRMQSLTPKQIRTKVKVARRFYLAEGYHHKFSLRNHPDLLPLLFPDGVQWREYIDSGMATKINGILASVNGKISSNTVSRMFEEFNVPRGAREYIEGVLVKRNRMVLDAVQRDPR